jgi:hypothetical protein
MSPPGVTDAERRRRAIQHRIQMCSGYVCEGWAMNVLLRAVQDVDEIQLGWGTAA